MAIYKCKMCGGDLNIGSDAVVVECDYCGTTQTVPTADNEKKLNLFNRANRLRLNSEFDKAAGIYESIIAEFPEEAEAYWGLCLCNYGIEYVDDPATGNKVPTCHRASFEKLASDENFSMAMEYADVVAQKVYRDEAREIDRIMEEILSVSKNEKPYDVFICYKETDDKGERTIDSVLAQDVYDALTAKGLKVFFARISLEDKLGKMYEPYIFAALNSAKVMLAIGTKYEHFHAVWVKNEWSRFLKIMAKDKSKALIPCYKDMDAYDMPDEFKALQAQDMGKIGFMQDLIRGVEKIVGGDNSAQKQNSVVNTPNNSEADNIVNIGFMDLQAGNQKKAELQFRSALEKEINNVMAYIGLCITDTVSDKERDVYITKINSVAPHITDSEKNIIFKNNELLAKYIILFSRYFFFSEERLVAALNYNENLINSLSVARGNENCSLISYVILECPNAHLVDVLLKLKANPNSVRTSANGASHSLMKDAMLVANSIDIMKLLLEAGADPNRIEKCIDQNGNTSLKSLLSIAIGDAENIDMVKLLLQYKANPNSTRVLPNGNSHSVLSDAIWYVKNNEIVKLLLEAGANPNCIEERTDKKGNYFKETMLSNAITDAKSPEAVELLLAYGADMDQTISLLGTTKPIRTYPFNKKYNISPEFKAFLKSKGWKGSIF